MRRGHGARALNKEFTCIQSETDVFAYSRKNEGKKAGTDFKLKQTGINNVILVFYHTYCNILNTYF